VIDQYGHHMIQLDEFDEPEFVDLDEAARRMNLSKRQVLHLCRIRALRCQWIPGSEPLVVPAILTGAVPA